MPAQEVSDGALIMVGGALLLSPGFLTDIVGLLFVFPVTRAALKGVFRKLLHGYALKRAGAIGFVGTRGKRIYDARVVPNRRRQSESPVDPAVDTPLEIPPTSSSGEQRPPL
jgi:UPF0716 family protein affecting phage T7 exclusion